MKLQEKLISLKEGNRAILAANFYNYETLRAVVSAAKQNQSEIILQLSESSIQYMGIEVAVAMARACIEAEGIEAWLHLDHGKDLNIVRLCIEAGFDSVMIDGSHLPFEENVKITSEVVKMAAEKGICVEAELGYVAKLGEEQRFEYTTPEEAQSFAIRTGIDSLAIAIGSAHGFYKQTPKLAFDVLQEIRAATPVSLVLHGSSGIPAKQIQEAIRLGINKVNLATEIKDTYMKSLREILKQTDEIDLRVVFPEAMKAVQQLIDKKIRMIRDA